ncbi:ribonuclease H-like domain-containing protein [Aspergillus aurantiobrunneus]
MVKRKTRHDPSTTDDETHPSSSQPPSSSPYKPNRRGHRFDEAVAAKNSRIQATAKLKQESPRQKSRAKAAKTEADAQADALRRIAEGKKKAADAKAEARAFLNKLTAARLKDSNIWPEDEHTEGKRVARRELAEAQARARAAEEDAVDKIAIAQAFAAALGHPSAAEDGGWTGLDEQEQWELLAGLNAACHSESVLRAAWYPIGRARAPRADPHSNPKKKAVALDCEFVGVTPWDWSVLAQVCAVDVLTGKVLLDVLVEPGQEVFDYRTPFSGLTERTFHRYRENGLVMADPAAAREALFRFIDRDTILVGFSLHNDLEKLDMSHYRVVDPQIVTRETVANKYGRDVRRRWALRDLCRGLLGRAVQKSSHDCLEDAFAPRELIIWWLEKSNKKLVEGWVEQQALDRNNYYDRDFLSSLECRRPDNP